MTQGERKKENQQEKRQANERTKKKESTPNAITQPTQKMVVAKR